MSHVRLKIASGLAGLEALGVAGPQDFFEPARLFDRSEVLEESASFLRARFALPGAPGESGRLTGRPRGDGTGWAVLALWRGAPLAACLRARLTHPRSASLAEREWNLLCRLRAAGIGTSEPLAVGARGAGLVLRDSFLVTRELEGAVSFPRWLARERPGPARALGLEALARALSRLARSGVFLPELAPEHLWITPGEERDCEPASRPVDGLRRNRLPGIAVADVRGGWIRVRPSSAARETAANGLLERLERAGLLAGAERARVLELAEGSVALDRRTPARR